MIFNLFFTDSRYLRIFQQLINKPQDVDLLIVQQFLE
jgi:hypothetical protein